MCDIKLSNDGVMGAVSHQLREGQQEGICFNEIITADRRLGGKGWLACRFRLYISACQDTASHSRLNTTIDNNRD